MGLRFVQQEFGNIVPGVFTPVLAKHSKSFSRIDCIAVGVDRETVVNAIAKRFVLYARRPGTNLSSVPC